MIKRSLLYFVAIALAVFVVNARAAKLPEKLRVLSCDLGGAAVQTSVEAEMKRLLDKADPDIVFLQGVADWETSDRVSKLRPGLRVLTCSAFPNQSNQVAVLARDKAILSWVDEIPGGAGFAFGVIQSGPRKLGIFSVQSPNNGGPATDRILAEVKKLQQFANNRPESFLVAGAALTKTALSEAGFETVAADALQKSKSPPAEFWTSNAGFLSRPRLIAAAGIATPVLVADIDTANTFSSKFAYQNALLFPGESPAPVQAVVVQPTAGPKRISGWIIFGGILFALVVMALILGRRKPTMALVTTGDSAVTPAGDEAVRQSLVSWVKTIFMQRLIADRRKMIADEAEATRRTLAIEQKLSDLQVALQDRISGYENRISRLESELSAATFENRELIRLQIDDLKAKVAKAKEDFVFRRN